MLYLYIVKLNNCFFENNGNKDMTYIIKEL